MISVPMDPKCILGTLGVRLGHNLNGTPVHYTFRPWGNLAYQFHLLACFGRKLVNPEETHLDTWRTYEILHRQ